MVQEKRRAERIAINLSVSVLLQDNKTGTILAGPVEAEVKNFSPMGLALSLDNIKIDNFHLFFTCQDNPSHFLKIAIVLPGKPEASVEVPARPAWYDRDKESKGKKALLGVEFMLKPRDKVIKMLAKELAGISETPTSWWQKKIF